MDCKQETPFRIGGTYRQQNGNYAKVIAVTAYSGAFPEFYPNRMAIELASGGSRNLHGHCCSLAGTRLQLLDLIPGELTQTPSGWVALGAEPAFKPTPPELVKAVLQDLAEASNSAMIARDGPARIVIPKPLRLTVRIVSNAKPNPFPNTLRSPDCNADPDHLNASRHQMAAKQFHKA